MDEPPRDEPLLTPEQRQELAGIAYFLAQCEHLHARGLIAEEAYRTIEAEYAVRRDAIEAQGRCEGALASARRLLVDRPREATPWADRARQLAPDRPEAWVLAIKSRQGWQDDEARAVAAEAVARFPGFPITPEDLQHERAVRLAQADQDRDETEVADLLARARAALDARFDDEVIRRADELLGRRPDHFDAAVLRAFALRRLDRLDEALAAYQRLREREPTNPVWAQWVRRIEDRRPAPRPAGRFGRRDAVAPAPAPTSSPEPAPTAPVPSRPRVSWGTITGEFLQDHWQKLILCLAVLLIVVSSNVGLYQLLGPRLWSPQGKSLLALVYTAMFAGLGTGLSRWGAARAGRMMLVTTLILVPFDFMLAGEMRLLTEPTLSRVVVLVLDAAALGVLIWRVVAALELPRVGRAMLIGGLFAISLTNVAAATGGRWPLAVFLLPSLLFVGAVWRLNARAPDADERDFTAIALGVLAFAFLSATLRTGLFVLHLAPSLFSVPVMLAAIAAVHTAHHLACRGPGPGWARGLRFGGVVLSALAIALALARPPGPSPLYSGNTLATAILGLALYAGSLRAYRQPAYLYFCFGALFLAYFGAFYFVMDLARAVEEVARRALGYEQKLPMPFKAINGLTFNAVLGLLAIFFARRWKDARLARHAHYLGVPFSIAACVFSGFEPKAAVICLSGYAVLYAVGAYLFAQPWVVYLACAATAGAAFFGTSLIPGMTIEVQALLASALGLVFWTVRGGFRAWRVEASYLQPLLHATLALMAAAMATAAVSVALPREVSLAAASTFLLVGLLAALIADEEPRGALALLAVIDLNLGLALLLSYLDARRRLGMEPAGFAVAAMAMAVLQAVLGDRLALRVDRSGPGRTLGLYLRPVLMAGFVQVAVGIGLVTWQVTRFQPPIPSDVLGAIAAAMALGTVALITLLRAFPKATLVYLSGALALGAWLALFEIALGGVFAVPAAYGASASAFALLLLGAAERLRSWLGQLKTADSDFAAFRPIRTRCLAAGLPDVAIVLAFLAAVVGIAGMANGPATVALFALAAGTLLWGTRFRRETALVYFGLAAAVAALECLVAWRVGWVEVGVTVAWLTLSGAGAAVGLWGAALAWRDREGGAFYARPCLVMASVLTAWVVPVAIFARVGDDRAFLPDLAALVMNVIASLLLSMVQRRPRLTYRAVISFVVATYLTLFSLPSSSGYGLLVASLTASVEAILFSAIGFYCRRLPAEGWARIHARPLFVSATVLTVLALIPGLQWPAAMLVAAVSFLLLVKGFSSEHWIYPAVAALAWAVFFYAELPAERLVTGLLFGAYELWLVGAMIRRVNTALRHWLALPGLDFDRPFFTSALIFATIATVLGAQQFGQGPFDGGALAGLAMNLAVLAVLMIKPFPYRDWLHGAIVLASASAGFSAYSRLGSPLDWLPLALGLANVWLLAACGVARYEGRLSRRFGVPELDYAPIPDLWSRAFFAIGGAAIVGLVVASTFTTAFAISTTVGLVAIGGWWSVVLALGLAGTFLAIAFGRRDRELLLMGGHALGVLLAWWLLAPSSPIAARLRPDVVAGSIATATALAALATAGLFLRWPGDPGGRRPFWLQESFEVPGERLSAYLWQVGLGLALVGVVFTKGLVSPSSIATLTLTAAALGLLAVGRRRIEVVSLAGLAWGATCIEAALAVGWRWGFLDLADRAMAASAGAGLAMLVLGAVAGRLRRAESLAPLALALERVALLGAGLASAAVGVGTAWAGRLGGAEAILGVGVLFAVALFAIWLAHRWDAEWPVYAGQAALLGAYFVYRDAFPHPVANDAALLTLFGYLEFGLAEAMHRLRLDRYARPTLHFSLAVPLLPLALMGMTGRLDEQNLFVLFGVATFYSIACFRMRWKALGYASAVLYNAALWVLWARIGWRFADNPQLFLVPVGFSAILFAEVNRRDLGRDAVNAIRGVGLILVYLSLAFPVWQFQSFGAWLALLLLSLVGIFVGIGLRVQTFVWLGLAGFTLDVVYQLGRMGLEHTLAKWAIMLALGLALILFVALNEKKRIVLTMRGYYEQVRQWE